MVPLVAPETGLGLEQSRDWHQGLKLLKQMVMSREHSQGSTAIWLPTSTLTYIVHTHICTYIHTFIHTYTYIYILMYVCMISQCMMP